MNGPAKACPLCAAPLQRLLGADGYPVERCLGNGRIVIVERKMDACYACPACEYVEGSRCFWNGEAQSDLGGGNNPVYPGTVIPEERWQ